MNIDANLQVVTAPLPGHMVSWLTNEATRRYKGKSPGMIHIKTGLLSLCLCVFCITMNAAYADTVKIRFAYIGDTEDSAYPGIRQGLNEANTQGQFLGQEYELDVIRLNETEQTDFSPYIALLVAADSDALISLSRRLPNEPVFNLENDDDSLRDICLDNVLHIAPSRRMKNDAVAQWRKKHPGAAVEAQAWHSDFVKFAARDLNKRFRKAFKKGMDDGAWAGWVAVKMTSDTVAREGITSAHAMLNYLQTRLSFDGQKGIEMNFRETGQLRQILLLAEHGKLVGEAPVRGVVETDDVDSLGITECPK
ncbi:MAG: ABC transporter substrate-binding protein [Gammaproteobacteria bacterium]